MPGVSSIDAPPPQLAVERPRKPLWKRLLKVALWTIGSIFTLVLVLAGTGWWLWSSGRLVPLLIQMQAKRADPAGMPFERPYPDTNAVKRAKPPLRRDAASVMSGGDLYQPTNVWETRIELSAREWAAMQPKAVSSRVHFDQEGGKFPLQNTNALRNGLLGTMGLDLDWTTARVEFGGVALTNVALRFKGNGTFLGALGGVKKPLKMDLARQVKGRTLAGLSILNFGNLSADFSCLSDTLAYEFFRQAGVPAPRTAFAHVTATVEGLWDARPLGLYVMAENVDAAFARDRFGTDKMGLFKPVTYDLFTDLGDDWAAYDRIYDPKLPATDAHKKRVIAAAKLVTKADDAEFARRAPEFFDFDETARFVAVNSLISSYDGFLNNGQNFFMYLDPKTDRFGFIPWDLDLAWGVFPFVGSVEDKEQASIDHPWVADHRLLERLFAVPEFKAIYRQRLEEIFRSQFIPERLAARVDELAPVVRAALVDDSDLRTLKFRDAVTDKWSQGAGYEGADINPSRPSHQLKRFFVRRKEHVEAQLAGKEKGVEFPKRTLPGQK